MMMRMKWLTAALVLCVAFAIAEESSIKFCKDEACAEQSDVFSRGEMLHIAYAGDASQAIAMISKPDGSKDQLALPATIVLDMAGTYSFDVLAGDPGERAEMITANIQVLGDAPEPLPPDAPERQEPVKPVVIQPIKEDDQPSILVLIYATLGALVIIGILFLVLRMKHKRQAQVPAKSLQILAVEHNVHQPHEFMNQVVSYIGESLKMGYSTEDIYNHLKGQGWSEDQINDSFRRYDLLGTYHSLKESNMPESEIKAELSKDYGPKQIEETLNHHSALLGRDATEEERNQHMDKLAHDNKVHLVDSKSAKMKHFMEQCLSHGYAMDHIRSLLTQMGWSSQKIDSASKKLIK
jgi:hypothetical protein